MRWAISADSLVFGRRLTAKTGPWVRPSAACDGLPHLPPAERRRATLRAAALSGCAHELLSGNTGPRPQPGDLTAIMRPNPV